MNVFRISTFFCLILMASCSTPPRQEQAFTLNPVSMATSQLTDTHYIISITRPLVPKIYESRKIVLFFAEKQQHAYYAVSTWNKNFPDIIQVVTQKSSTSILPYLALSDNADLRLVMAIHSFQPVYKKRLSETPHLEASIEFNLYKSSQIMRSFTIEKRVQARSSKTEDIIRDMELMLQDIQLDAFNRIDIYLRR